MWPFSPRLVPEIVTGRRNIMYVAVGDAGHQTIVQDAQMPGIVEVYIPRDPKPVLVVLSAEEVSHLLKAMARYVDLKQTEECST